MHGIRLISCTEVQPGVHSCVFRLVSLSHHMAYGFPSAFFASSRSTSSSKSASQSPHNGTSSVRLAQKISSTNTPWRERPAEIPLYSIQPAVSISCLFVIATTNNVDLKFHIVLQYCHNLFRTDHTRMHRNIESHRQSSHI